MTAIAAWLLQNALVATAMALVLLLATRWLRPRPALEHLMWLLVTVKFVLPPLAVLTLPSAVVDPVASMATEWQRESAEPTTTTPQTDEVIASTPSAATERSGESAVPSDTRARRTLPFSAVTLLIGLWLLAAALGVVWRLTRHHFWQRRVVAAAEPAPRELRSIVDDCASRLRVDAPRVVVSRGAPAPLVTGLRRPVLFWPAGLIGALGVERTRTIVMHELAHVRRRDLWTGVIEIMVDSLWRWYPGWRIVRRRLRDAAERACDAIVVESDPDGRRQYAEAILDVLSLGARRRQAALSLGVDGPGPLELRIQGILHPQTTRAPRAVGYASLALVGLLVLPWWSREPAAPQLTPVSAAAPAPAPAPTAAPESHDAVSSADVEAVTSRGVVRWNGRYIDLEPGSWLVAFARTGGSSRRLEARNDADGERTLRWVIDGREARYDAEAAEWLRGVIERRGYDAARTRSGEVKSASGGGGTFLNWLNNDVESLSYWSTLPSHGVRRDGRLDPSVDAEHPVYLIHQVAPDAPVEFMALAHDGDGLRVLERSLDARAAPTDATAEARAREMLRLMAGWIY